MQKSKLAEILKIVGEKNRMEILCILFRNTSMTVSSIANTLELSVATTSHHLKTMEENGVIVGQRNGKEIYYSASKLKILIDIRELICSNTNMKL